MGAELLIGIIAAIAGALVAFVGLVWQMPKIRAEARKLEAEASRIEWQTLHDEIKRLDGLTTALRHEMDTLKSTSAEREGELDRENRQLRTKVARLEKRIGDLEAIFKIGPLPPDMQAALDKLDKIEGGGK